MSTISTCPAGLSISDRVAAFLIHVMGERTPRATVFDSVEAAIQEAALLGIRRRLYTVVTVDDVGEDVSPEGPPHVAA